MPGRRPAPSRRPPQRRGPAAGELLGAASRATVAACGRAVARAKPGRRVSSMLVIYLLLVGLVGWRLVTIQVVAAEEYRGLAAAQTQRELALPARRGRITDRSGQPLAMSLAAATVYANPKLIARGGADPADIAAQLAPLLDIGVDDLVAKLTADAHFVYLGRQLPRQVGEQVTAMELAGIGVLEEPTRTYPAGGLAAQVVGFAGIDNTGLSGLERQYEDVLAGRPGTLSLETAPGGLVISAAPREVSPPVAGTDLVLTLDRQIQYTAERVLTEAVDRYSAIGGSAVVLDVATGEVLAMASVPGFDPRAIGEADGYARRNRAVTDVFEPGSVNKALTAAAALEEDLVTPSSWFTVPDRWEHADKVFKDSTDHETEQLTFAEIIAQSSNVGTIQVAERLGSERLYDYLVRFGYGRESGLGFPGESGGLLRDRDEWSGTSLPTMAIGQGVSATLLQVAEVFEVIASGGEWVEPSLVRGTIGPGGALEEAAAPERRRVVSEETADAVARMLVGVVEGQRGTGSLAAVDGYAVGGKTGTAQKPSEFRRGYEEGAYIASFAGFAPAEDPAIVVAVMLDEPRPVFYGGVVAAPVFSEIMDFALTHRRVQPTDPVAARPAPEPERTPTGRR